ncbi:hypothetical protein ACIEGP_25205 [Citrobacter freundii]|uniref:hypothetical protein n=1 Tax=Citrobacter freundii TaxID=546 RepID=UPI0037CA6DA6
MTELEVSLNRIYQSFWIMEGLIEETESLINKSLRDFEKSGPRICSYDHDFGSDEYYKFRGFASYNFDEVVENYATLMPSRLRASAFLTMFGMFECNIESLTQAILKFNDQIWRVSDFNQKGLERCNLILKKLLPITHSESRNLISCIVKLRNLCAHNNRYVSDHILKDGNIKRLISESGCIDTKRLNGEHELIFKRNSLHFILECFINFHNEVINSLNGPGFIMNYKFRQL